MKDFDQAADLLHTTVDENCVSSKLQREAALLYEGLSGFKSAACESLKHPLETTAHIALGVLTGFGVARYATTTGFLGRLTRSAGAGMSVGALSSACENGQGIVSAMSDTWQSSKRWDANAATMRRCLGQFAFDTALGCASGMAGHGAANFFSKRSFLFTAGAPTLSENLSNSQKNVLLLSGEIESQPLFPTNPSTRTLLDNQHRILELMVTDSKMRGLSQGSGFLVETANNHKLVLTANHVIRELPNNGYILTRQPGTSKWSMALQVVGADMAADTAVLRPHLMMPGVPEFLNNPYKLPSTPLDLPNRGATLNSLGFYEGKLVVSEGKVGATGPARTLHSNLPEFAPTGEVISGYFPVEPGMSGGPVFDQSGRLVALNSCKTGSLCPTTLVVSLKPTLNVINNPRPTMFQKLLDLNRAIKKPTLLLPPST